MAGLELGIFKVISNTIGRFLNISNPSYYWKINILHVHDVLNIQIRFFFFVFFIHLKFKILFFKIRFSMSKGGIQFYLLRVYTVFFLESNY